jgi:hypothetical protein
MSRTVARRSNAHHPRETLDHHFSSIAGRPASICLVKTFVLRRRRCERAHSGLLAGTSTYRGFGCCIFRGRLSGCLCPAALWVKNFASTFHRGGRGNRRRIMQSHTVSLFYFLVLRKTPPPIINKVGVRGFVSLENSPVDLLENSLCPYHFAKYLCNLSYILF